MTERFVIETADFVDRDEASAFFKDMLRRHRPGMSVGPADAMHLRALLDLHPDRDAKVGPGVRGFTVLRTEHNTPCFGAVRVDGTVVDFSLRHCIQGRVNSRFGALKKALRLAVRGDIEVLRAQGHVPGLPGGDSFGDIVKAFLVLRGLDARGITLETRQGRITPEIADAAVVEDFRAFHRAKLAA